MATILYLDDDSSAAGQPEQQLGRTGHRVIHVASAEEALRVLASRVVDVLVVAERFPGGGGLESQLERGAGPLPLIRIVESANMDFPVDVGEAGLVEQLPRPVRAEALERAVLRVLEVARLRRENAQLREELSRHGPARLPAGESPTFRRVMETVHAVAPTEATVLLEGEPGTGKQLLARTIHDRSLRHEGPFVSVNCAAMAGGMLGPALFGEERGDAGGRLSYTRGALERAHGGSLLLVEISAMALELQAELLRVIREREFDRVGGQHPVRVDVRLLATTSRDLKAECDAGRFRTDLFYRFNMVPIRIPPLRDRKADIPALADHFARRAAERLGVPVPRLEPEAMDLLMRHAWPGNVRELANVVERGVILTRGGNLSSEALEGVRELGGFRHQAGTGAPLPERLATAGAAAVGAAPAQNLPHIVATDAFNLDELERQAIARAMEATGGNRTRAAKLLGISERTLRNKLNVPKV